MTYTSFRRGAIQARLNGITRSPIDPNLLTSQDVLQHAAISMLNYYSRKEVEAVTFHRCCATVLTFCINICRNEARNAAPPRAVYSKILGTLESRGYRPMQL